MGWRDGGRRPGGGGSWAGHRALLGLTQRRAAWAVEPSGGPTPTSTGRGTLPDERHSTKYRRPLLDRYSTVTPHRALLGAL